MLKWDELDAWVTPNAKFFRVAHYHKPLGPVIDEKEWKLEITGLVKRPMTFTLRELKARPRQEIIFTLECSGNRTEPLVHGLVGNAKWAGTPLAPLLQEDMLDQGIEVVFVGSDVGEEELRGIKMPHNFARSMSLQDALHPHNLLCYEMNGAPLPSPTGFRCGSIAPGWYGIANLKWLKRIEVRETRFMGPWMAREYVTLRQEQRDGDTVWMETSVGRALLKSVPAKVTRKNGQYRIVGAAWGAPSSGWRSRSTVGHGGKRPSIGTRRPNSRGSSGLWSGRNPLRVSTPLCLGPLTPWGISSRPWMTPGSPRSRHGGRATDSSRGGFASPDMLRVWRSTSAMGWGDVQRPCHVLRRTRRAGDGLRRALRASLPLSAAPDAQR